MPRVKNGVITRQRRKKILEKAKGYTGGRRKLFKSAKETVIRAGAFAFRDRKVKKRDFRNLWIARLNAALHEHNLNYSKFIHMLSQKSVGLNRKVLSNIAIEDPITFAKIVEFVKS